LTVTKTTQYAEMPASVQNVIVDESSKEETHPIRTVCKKKNYWWQSRPSHGYMITVMIIRVMYPQRNADTVQTYFRSTTECMSL